MNKKSNIYVFCFALCFFITGLAHGQISAPGSNASDKTNYPVFPATDSIYIYCVVDSLSEIGNLRVETQLAGTKTFLWEKYNNITASFEFFFSESSDNFYSEITEVADGGYRATVTLGANTEIHRAWLFNNWTVADGFVSESNCESFKLNGEFRTAILNYYDLADNSKLEVFKNLRVQWKEGDEIVAVTLNTQIFSPPTKDTDYTLRVYDKFECEGIADVIYESIVTKAAFSVSPQNGEAPLLVNFSNESENGDPNLFEWFLFKDLDEIKREGENTDGPIDSIMIVAYDENPIYTYENSGTYNVKLVSKNISEFHACVDTVYIDDYIVVDTSFIAVPNVFTPNGDGTNDDFVVQFWSMESIKISIFNRWGKRIHFWKSDDIQGFEGTWSETVWDGRLMGGRFASPGVYYYNVVGEGRDGEKRRAHGFFHLFRGKN
jgi:gliding motility-associated-like protein